MKYTHCNSMIRSSQRRRLCPTAGALDLAVDFSTDPRREGGEGSKRPRRGDRRKRLVFR